jgi:hypothetical protein
MLAFARRSLLRTRALALVPRALLFSTRAEAAADARAPPPPAAEVADEGAAKQHTFQAETKQLLNIVANSLYTDKHVFIRCVPSPPLRPSRAPPPNPHAPLSACHGESTLSVLKLGSKIRPGSPAPPPLGTAPWLSPGVPSLGAGSHTLPTPRALPS